MQVYSANLDAWRAGVDAEMRNAQLNMQQFTASVEAWKANTQVQVSVQDMKMRYAELRERHEITYAQMQIERFRAQIGRAQAEAQMALEQAKAIATLMQTTMAGLYSQTNTSVDLGVRGGFDAPDNVELI